MENLLHTFLNISVFLLRFAFESEITSINNIKIGLRYNKNTKISQNYIILFVFVSNKNTKISQNHIIFLFLFQIVQLSLDLTYEAKNTFFKVICY